MSVIGMLVMVAAGSTITTTSEAGDGVFEINEACVAFGCFDGDSTGFPVEITEPGSYRLTSNLDIGSENTTAILVTVSDVTVDLNGFAIRGVVDCDADGVCSTTGDGIGVEAEFASDTDLTVHGGMIRGMGDDGVECQRGCAIRNMNLVSNGNNGANMVNGAGVLVNNVARQNGNHGLRARGVFRNNTAEDNGGNGIHDRSSSVVANNQVFGNKNGMRCNRCTLLDNNIRNNDEFGVMTAGRVGFARNVITGNTSGTVDSGGILVELGTNLCDTNTTCP